MRNEKCHFDVMIKMFTLGLNLLIKLDCFSED